VGGRRLQFSALVWSFMCLWGHSVESSSRTWTLWNFTLAVNFPQPSQQGEEPHLKAPRAHDFHCCWVPSPPALGGAYCSCAVVQEGQTSHLLCSQMGWTLPFPRRSELNPLCGFCLLIGPSLLLEASQSCSHLSDTLLGLSSNCSWLPSCVPRVQSSPSALLPPLQECLAVASSSLPATPGLRVRSPSTQAVSPTLSLLFVGTTPHVYSLE
jgi:hypothetical protein